MKFSCLHIENYRGSRELEVDFEPDMTVIAGRNGSGKTAILDALATISNWVLFESSNPSYDPFAKASDSAKKVRKSADLAQLRLEYENTTRHLSPIASRSTAVKNAVTMKIHEPEGIDLEVLFDTEIERQFDSFQATDTLIVYYRENRRLRLERNQFVKSKPSADSISADTIRRQSLTEGMHPAADLSAWWNQRCDMQLPAQRNNPGCQDPQLRSVAETVRSVEGFCDLTFHSDEYPKGLHFVKESGTKIHVNELSGGERAYIVLLADLAHRLQVVSPGKPVGEIPAIVMIDEVELSLHPGWQSEIIPTLRETFPSCQFILTTHSPQVLSCVDNRMVRVIEEEVPDWSWKIARPYSTRGQTSDFLLEAVLGASEREPAAKAAIRRFNDAIDNKDINGGIDALKDVEERIGDDAPTLLVLNRRLNRLRSSV